MMKTALEGAVAIHFYRPSPELAPYVSTYYLTEVNLGQGGKVEDWLHPEWANLRFTAQPRLSSALGNAPLQALPETIFTGPTSQSAHFVIEGRARVWGVGLLPAGLARFVAAPASDLADRIVPVAPGGPLAPFVRIGAKVLTGKRDPAGPDRASHHDEPGRVSSSGRHRSAPWPGRGYPRQARAARP